MDQPEPLPGSVAPGRLGRHLAPDTFDMSVIVEEVPDGLLAIDEAGRILVANRRVEELFGYERSEVLGQSVEMLLPERFRDVHRAHRARYWVDSRSRPMGTVLGLWGRRSDGSEFPVEISLSPTVAGTDTVVVATIRDISDRVASEARQRLIQHSIEAVHDGVYVFDPDTLRFTYVNQGAVDQSGYSREELQMMAAPQLAPEFTRERLLDDFRSLLDDEVSRVTLRTVVRSRAGVDTPVEAVVEYPPAPYPGAHRDLVAVVRDLTERRAIELRFEASEAAFRKAFDEAPVGMMIVTITPDGSRVLQRVNAAFARLVGFSEDELVGVSLSELGHPDDEEEGRLAAVEIHLHVRTEYEAEKRYRRRDGGYVWTLLHSAVLAHDAGGTTVLAHVLDISARRAAEAERDRQHRWLAGLADIRKRLLEAALTDDVLSDVCRYASGLAGAHLAAIGMADSTGENLELRARYGATPDHSLKIDSAIRAALGGREALVLNDGLPDDVDDALLNRIGPTLLVPLSGGGSAESGLLLIARPPGSAPFESRDVELIESFALQATAVLDLDAARRDRERMSVLEDRERIAADLHDLVIQRLFVAGMRLESILGRDAAGDAHQQIHQTIDDLDDTIREVRSSIFRLHDVASDGPLTSQIEAVVARYRDRLGFTPSLALTEGIDELPPLVVEQLLPSLSEALANAARHAHATQVDVTIHLGKDDVTLAVSDNGVGFDPQTAVRGSGLLNLEARARRLGGACEVSSGRAAGCRISWSVPLQ